MDHRTYAGKHDQAIAFNPMSKTTTTPIFDCDNNIVAMVEAQEHEAVEGAAIMAKISQENALDLKGGTQRHMRLAAEIPNIFVNDLMRRGIWQDTDRLIQWIEQEAPRDFKAYAGRIR